jgi:hypothetical protein
MVDREPWLGTVCSNSVALSSIEKGQEVTGHIYCTIFEMYIDADIVNEKRELNEFIENSCQEDASMGYAIFNHHPYHSSTHYRRYCGCCIPISSRAIPT